MAQSAPALVGTPNAATTPPTPASSSTGTATVTIPSDVSAGDYLVLLVMAVETVNVAPTVSDPSGATWNQIGSASLGTGCPYYAFGRFAGATDAGTTVTASVPYPANYGYWSAAVLPFSGVGGDPIVVASTAASQMNNAATLTWPAASVTTADANCLIVETWAFTSYSHTGTISSSALPSTQALAFTGFNGSAVCSFLGVSTKGQPAAGPSTADDATVDMSAATSGQGTSITIALPPVQPPATPTITEPANASYVDTPITLGWSPNPTTGDGPQSDVAIRAKISGASSYNYWSMASNAWQSTIVWNPYTSDSYTFPTAAFTVGNVYNVSVATEEATEGLQSQFASDITFTCQAPPSVTVTGPSGAIATASPTVTATATPAAGASVTGYRVVVYTAAQVAASGFTPGGTPNVYDSGTVASTSTSVSQPVSGLSSNATFYAYVEVTETGGESAWGSAPFTVTFDAPAQPTVTVTAGTAPSTGAPAPMVTVQVQGHDNLLSALDASFEGSPGTWAPYGGGVLYVTSSYALDGSDSMALAQAATGSDAITGAYSVVGGASYVIMGAFRAVSQPRTVLMASYEGVYGRQVSDSPDYWTWSIGVGTEPSAATTDRLIAQPIGATLELATPAAPTVTPEGTAGSTAYDYSVSVANIYGTTPASNVGSTSTGNATLSSTDYNLVTWPAVPEAAGAPGNLIYDSQLTNAIAAVGPTWAPEGTSVGTSDGDIDVVDGGTLPAQVIYYGTGGAQNFEGLRSQSIAVTPNTTYTVSCYSDFTAATAGNGSMRVFTESGTLLTQPNNNAGTAQVDSGSFTTDSTTTFIYCDVTVAGATLPAGATVSWSYLSLVEGEPPANLVFDSNLAAATAATNPTWNAVGATIGSANGDFDVLNPGEDYAAWVYYGTGSASGYPHPASVAIPVTAGSTYTISSLIDASAVTAGSPFMGVYDPAITTQYGSVSQTAGTSGTVSDTFTVPSGVTQVAVVVDTNNCTVTAGAMLTWSQIQLTETSTVQPYTPGIKVQAGPLPTYTVYGRSGTALTELGTTTALGIEDTGQALGTGTPATVNTTGETHLIDCAGIFPGNTLGYQLEVLSDGPAAYWPLDDSSGSTVAKNAVGSGVGTVHGGVTFGEAGVVASDPSQTAALFDGSTGYVSTNYQPTFDAITVEVWAKGLYADFGENTRVLAAGGAGGSGFDFYADNNSGIYLEQGGTSYKPGWGNVPFDGNWHHFALTWDGSTVVSYTDGVQTGSAAAAHGPITCTNPLSIGAYSPGGDFFPGDIAHVAVYPTALSAARIQAHYDAALNTAGHIVQKWTRGGLVGSTTAAVTYTDANTPTPTAVRGATAVPIPSPSQQATIIDYEAPLTIPRVYTATVNATV